MWTLVHDRKGYIPPTLPIAVDQALTGDQIEELAAQTRMALGLDASGPILHVTRALERGGIVVAPLALSGGDDDTETVGHFGASCWPGPPDPAIVGYFHGASGDRQRFTLAHEVGHLVLHTRRTFVASPEDEANRFAGAFLVPRSSYAEFIGDQLPTLREFVQMKARWGVSIQALIMRGSHLGHIDDSRKTSLFKQISARGYRKVEPVTVHPEEPVLFRKLVEADAKSGKSSYTAAEDRLGLGAFTLAGLAPRSA
ncbi:MAG: helix-turn-helix domain protein [Frankiales bacterium]|nr:helix-turn-helix domain protein [Frankiales bacterium]